MSTYFVGIDISKYKHDCCIINAADQSIVAKFTFQNDKDGFKQLLTSLQSLSSPEDIRIGFESTAHYALNLELFLEKASHSFMEINPVLITSYSFSVLIIAKGAFFIYCFRQVTGKFQANTNLLPFDNMWVQGKFSKTIRSHHFTRRNKMGTWNQSTNDNNDVEVNYTGTNFYRLACNNGSYDGKGRPIISLRYSLLLKNAMKNKLLFMCLCDKYTK